MIDLHTHTLFSDGELLPSELVRRAEAKGYTAIALTDHVDGSNIDFVIPRIVNICRILNRHWKIRAIPGAEITHAPLKEIAPLAKLARREGARIVIVHGETISEPVIPGTNRAGIEAGCDILAHPGLISRKDMKLAKARGVYLELTTRKAHSRPNRRLFTMARTIGARLIINNDAHSEEDLVSEARARQLLKSLGATRGEIAAILANSIELAAKKAQITR